MVNAWMQTVKKVRDEMPKGTSLKEILVAAKKVYKKPAGLVKKAVSRKKKTQEEKGKENKENKENKEETHKEKQKEKKVIK